MESVSHCDERSLLAPQRQHIMSVLQVTVLWVTTIFYTLRLGNESRSVWSSNVHQDLWCSGTAAKRVPLAMIRCNQMASGCYFLCSESLQQSLSPSWHIVTLCVYVWQNDWIHIPGCMSCQLNGGIFISLGCQSGYSVKELYLVSPSWSVLNQDTETIFSSDFVCC